MGVETVPLKGSFMLTSIIGIMISIFYVFGQSKTWGFTFTLFFVVMFIASLISMTTSPIDAEESLDRHYKKKRKKKQ